jgi:hypothetical protein
MKSLSLKSLLPAFARAVGKTPAVLYERQRALVRAGLLRVEEGWGPGSGVRATPEAAALLLIAILATDTLSETEASTKRIAQLKSECKKGCTITGKKTFASALAALLASESMAKSVHKIYVGRNEEEARIDSIDEDGGKSSSYFRGVKLIRGGPFYVSAELVPFPLELIAKALHGDA